jgi:hypothetical protein
VTLPPRSGHGRWDMSLREGEAREDAFVHVLLQARVEHKRDKKAFETGNIAIEFAQGPEADWRKKRPSGIAISEAEWWAIEYRHRRWLLIDTEQLRDLARKALRENKVKPMGDNGNVGALIPLQWLFDRSIDGPLELLTGAEGFGTATPEARKAA